MAAFQLNWLPPRPSSAPPPTRCWAATRASCQADFPPATPGPLGFGGGGHTPQPAARHSLRKNTATVSFGPTTSAPPPRSPQEESPPRSRSTPQVPTNTYPPWPAYPPYSLHSPLSYPQYPPQSQQQQQQAPPPTYAPLSEPTGTTVRRGSVPWCSQGVVV